MTDRAVRQHAVEPRSLARRAMRVSPTMPSSEHGDIILGSGDACPSVLPDLTDVAKLALTTYRGETLQYAPVSGLPDLRAWIAEYMRSDGSDVTAEEVVVVNGAKHGIDLVCRLLLDEGDSIVVTSPTYFTSIPIFRSFGVSFVEVGQDGEGIDVDEVRERLDDLARRGAQLPKFIYNVPDFHNPTGVTMTRRRREALIEVAARRGVMIVEDSPYRNVRFEGEAEPTLKALGPDHTILVGTFAKLVAPGLRVGWVSAAPDLLARLAQLKSDGGSCPLTQRIILEFCRAGGLAAHGAVVRETYREHSDRMVAAVRRELTDASFIVPQGGYYLWVALPDSADGDELEQRAWAARVSITAGTRFFAGDRGGPPKHFIRLAYSHATVDQIDDGVRRVASALASMRREQRATAV
jgi:2-aminoadipate transaminase